MDHLGPSTRVEAPLFLDTRAVMYRQPTTRSWSLFDPALKGQQTVGTRRIAERAGGVLEFGDALTSIINTQPYILTIMGTSREP